MAQERSRESGHDGGAMTDESDFPDAYELEQAREHLNEAVRLLFRLFPELNDDDAEEGIPPEARRICMELGEIEGCLGSLVRDRSRP